MAKAIVLELEVKDDGTPVIKKFSDSTEKNIKGSTTKSRSHLKKLQDRFKKMGGGALALGKKIGQLALKFGALAAAAVGGFGIGKSLSEFAAFETAVVDMGKVTGESADIIRAKMLAIPSVLGDATAMTKGYYATISAGVTEPTAAMDLLTTAAKAGKASHTELAGTIEGMTKMMAGFEGKITSATAASDLLFAIEKEGQTTFSQLIPVIGTVSKLSSDLGVTQQEMAGSLALISQTAANTSEAATHYRATLIALMKPTEAMKSVLNDMGYESSQSAIASLGLAGTLKALKDSTGGSADKMAELFGRQEALIGMSELSANGFGNLQQKVEAMGQATGGTDKAFNRYKMTLAGVWDTAKNTIGKQLILIGEKMAPAVSKIVEKTGTWLDKNKELVAGEVGFWLENIVKWAKEFWPHVQSAAKYVSEWYQLNKGLIASGLGDWIGQVAKVAGVLANEALPALLKVLNFLGTALTVLYGPFQAIIWLVEKLVKVFGFLIGKIADAGKALFGFVGKWGGKSIDFVMNFFGKGSATLPLSEKIDEMDNRIQNFASKVESTVPKLTVDASQVHQTLDGVQSRITGQIVQPTGWMSPNQTMYATKYPSYSGFAHGTDFVPQTGMYMLHKGEEVKRPQEAGRGNNSFGNINVYIPEGAAPQSPEDYRTIVRDFIIPEMEAAGRI